MIYYNENDPFAAAWLRNNMALGLIPQGDVDDRSIADVRPDDVRGYRSCHFFAGIGGWAYAFRLAGWPDDRPVWSGSCPCQPFSVAGKGGGADDPRHLWPHFFRLIDACRPGVILGEQVSGKAGVDWFDGIAADLEAGGYAAWAVDAPSCAVDAPHIRQRLYWLAVADADCIGGDGRAGTGRGDWKAFDYAHGGDALADADGGGCPGRPQGQERGALRRTAAERIDGGRVALADADGQGRALRGQPHLLGQRPSAARTDAGHGGLADAPRPGQHAGRGDHHSNARPEYERVMDGGASRRYVVDGDCGADSVSHGERDLVDSQGLRWREGRPEHEFWGGRPAAAGANGSYWAGAAWLACHDGKARRTQPGLSLLVDGLPNRISAWRGFGNAINPEFAKEVIAAYMDVADG